MNRSPHGGHRPPTIGRCALTAAPRLDPESVEVRELLEALDDAMFTAIAGGVAALKSAVELWARAIDALGPELVEESREQYLRYAVEMTRQFEWNGTRDPGRAMAAVEVIELLTRN